jgi:hypothetical protein
VPGCCACVPGDDGSERRLAKPTGEGAAQDTRQFALIRSPGLKATRIQRALTSAFTGDDEHCPAALVARTAKERKERPASRGFGHPVQVDTRFDFDTTPADTLLISPFSRTTRRFMRRTLIDELCESLA